MPSGPVLERSMQPLPKVTFRDGTEDYWSRQRLSERIQSAVLPPNLTPGLDPLSSPTGQIYYYTLESDTKGLRELSEIQRWVVIPALKQVPGIADVQNFGGITTQFQLELDPQQLMRFGLSLANVEAAAAGYALLICARRMAMVRKTNGARAHTNANPTTNFSAES